MNQHTCNHEHIAYLGIIHHMSYPEKCFKCQDCNTIITDYITSEEMSVFHENNTLSMQL